MEQKSRKLLSRVGAAFMLGLSMFNFGAAWNKMRGSGVPRNTRNIRKRTQAELDVDVKEVATIAEEEAQTVLAMKQFEQDESQQQLQSETMSISQKSIRYAAVGVWVVSAGFVFSSAVFNYPFALGKGMLSLLPGVPHVASLQLETQGRFFEVGQEIPVKVLLDSQGEDVDEVVVSLHYDSTQLSFERYEIKDELFASSKEFLTNPQEGAISLTLKNSLGGVVSAKNVVATFFFQGKEESSTGVELEQAESFVLKKTKKGEFVNILGKVGDSDFRILPSKNEEAFCFEMKNLNQEGVDQWEMLAKGAILPKEKSNWNMINSQWGFVCAHQETGEVYFLLSGPREDLESIKLTILEKEDADSFLSISKKWKENERYFFGAMISGSDLNQAEGVWGIDLKVELPDEQLRWPKQGQAKLIFQ